MNVVVLGAGALGVYFGGRMLEAGHAVTFLVRERRAEQIKQQGLTIHSPKGNYTLNNPHIETDVTNIQDIDLVLFAVKGYHVQGALNDLKTLADKGAYILSVLNGVEHLTILDKHLGDTPGQAHPVIGGLSFIIATLDEHGHVHHTSEQHDLVFGARHPSQETFIEKLNTALKQTNMGRHQSEDISLAIWEKYMFITAFSSVTIATNLPIGIIRQYPETFDIGINVLYEMKTLANAYQVALTEEHVNKALTLTESLPPEGTSSMHQDKRKGLALELDHLQGAALRLAEQANIELPTIELIYRMNLPFARGNPNP